MSQQVREQQQAGSSSSAVPNDSYGSDNLEKFRPTVYEGARPQAASNPNLTEFQFQYQQDGPQIPFPIGAQAQHNPNDNDPSAAIPYLEVRDVTALIVNKMVGTGVFIAPPLVLLYTGNKAEALGLCMFLYLEYSIRLPFTGGEMIYLDAFIPRPKLFMYTLYAIQFVLLMHNSTNCLQFGSQVILADLRDPEVNQRLVRFFGIVILTVVCLIIYFNNTIFRYFNLTVAWLKFAGLIVLFGKGLQMAIAQETKTFGAIDQSSYLFSESPLRHFLALLQVLFAFNGWENATFVRSEIKEDRVLRLGFILGGAVVGISYILINIVFLIAIGEPGQALNSAFRFAPWLFDATPTAQRVWAIAIAVSAAGSMGAIMYTSCKVAQSIAAANILPWSRLWVRQHRVRSPTPAGALLLIWLFGVITLAATAAIKKLDEAISFPGAIQIYVEQSFSLVIMGGGLVYLLRRRAQPAAAQDSEDPRLQTEVSKENNPITGWRRKTIWVIIPFIMLCNLAVVVLPCIGPWQTVFGHPIQIKGFIYPATLGVILLSSTAYYFLCFGIPKYSILRLAGLKVEIIELCGGGRHKKFGYRYRVYITLDDRPESIPTSGPPSRQGIQVLNPGQAPHDIDPDQALAPDDHGQAPDDIALQPSHPASGPSAAGENPAIHHASIAPSIMDYGVASDQSSLIRSKSIRERLASGLRWFFGWNMSSQRYRVDLYHGPNAQGCTCPPQSELIYNERFLVNERFAENGEEQFR